MSDHVQSSLQAHNFSTDQQVVSAVGQYPSGPNSLQPLKGFKLDFSANRGFRKFFYSAKCDCGTSALLSVEISERKELMEIKKAAPELAKILEDRAKTFYDMSCKEHMRMRLGAPVGDSRVKNK